MKSAITLKINGNKVDIVNSEQFAQQFSITYSFSDLYEPDKVTDSYSKSITLPGTANNNAIFGHIWKFDFNNVDKFNASQLSDFQLFLNNELWQTGTAQLQEISIKDNVISYKVVLFGSITRVMSMLLNSDIEDDNNKLLRNLKYKSKLTHTLTPETIGRMWDGHNHTGYIDLQDYMQYIPCQNGLYDNFSSNKALRYKNRKWVVGPVIESASNEDINSGDTEFDEYTMNEYRVEYQRPAMKMNKLIEQICTDIAPDASINLDRDFFNNNNPYWNNTYLTLSQYTTETNEGYVTAEMDQNDVYVYVPLEEDQFTLDFKFMQTAGDFQLFAPDSSTVIYYENISGKKTISIEFKIRVLVMNDSTIRSDMYLLNGTWNGEIGDEMVISGKKLPRERWPVSVKAYSGGMQSIGVDGGRGLFTWARENIANWGNMSSDEHTGSSVKNLTRTASAGYVYNSSYSTTYRYGYPISFSTLTADPAWTPTVDSYYTWMPFKFNFDVSDLTGEGTIQLELSGITHNFTQWQLRPVGGGSSRYFLAARKSLPVLLVIAPITKNNEWPSEVAGFTGKSVTAKYNTAIRSGDNSNGQYSGVVPSRVTTDDMFDTTTTQGQVLLDYTKLLGLLYDVDKEGNLNILSRNKYFNDYKIIDWSSKVDYSKEIKFKPLTFDARYFEMKYKSGDTYYENKYKNEFGLEYGEKKINTGLAFNSETKQFLGTTIFTNTIISADVRRTYTGSDKGIIYMNEDPIPMPALYQKDGETKSSADLKYNLLFRKSYRDNKFDGYITCDSSIMMDASNGGGEYCWWDRNQYGEGSDIATNCIILAKNYGGIPTFSTHYDDYSWDIGLPRISYDGTMSNDYSSASTVYSRYWENYISEIYNVRNKILTCYVRLSWIEILNFSFKNFVTINGVLYHPNKLINVNPLSDDPVQVELIQVQDINAYTSGQRIPGSTLVNKTALKAQGVHIKNETAE